MGYGLFETVNRRGRARRQIDDPSNRVQIKVTSPKMVLMSGHTVPSLVELKRIATDNGLNQLEAARAQVLEPGLRTLRTRREQGLSATMQFTYRNPERSTDPSRTLANAQTLLVASRAYGEPLSESEESPPGPNHGKVARYAVEDPYTPLRIGLGAIADRLKQAGYKAVVVADSNALVDRNTAWLAGLGWYGKNTMMMNRSLGSWFVVGTVITDAYYSVKTTTVADGCATCTACLDACPTGAIVGPGVLDARRCIAWLVQAGESVPESFRTAVGDRIYGCDICQDVCPPNRVVELKKGRSANTNNPVDAESVKNSDLVDLEWVLRAGDEELMAELGHWYIANRDPDVIRRTALVVLGNVGDPSNPTTLQLVKPYLDHGNPMLVEHAKWAVDQLANNSNPPAQP